MKEIPLTRGKVALVDDEDYEWLSIHKWHYHPIDGYAMRTERDADGRRRYVCMHRKILGLAVGDPRIGDHIDGNTINNTRKNLRITDSVGNARNRRTKNSTGYKGVKKASSARWTASITVARKTIHLGSFDSAEEAHEAYRSASSELFGEFANDGRR